MLQPRSLVAQQQGRGAPPVQLPVGTGGPLRKGPPVSAGHHGGHQLQARRAGCDEAIPQGSGLHTLHRQGQDRPAGRPQDLGLQRIGPVPQPHLPHSRRQGGAHRGRVSRGVQERLRRQGTPYGFKRDRWVKVTIENGFKLPRSTLGAEPKAGTLLQNLTYFLGRLVFRDSAPRLRQLDAAAPEVAPCLRTYAYDSLDITRIVETCTVTAVAKRRVSLVTELVEYPRRSRTRGNSSSLLVYSLSDPEQGGMRLVTAFDVGPDMVAGLLADSGFGRRVSIRPRYNCYVPGFTGELPGSRRIA